MCRKLCCVVLIFTALAAAQQGSDAAAAAYQAQDWERAARLYAEKVKAEPEQPQPRYRLGVSLSNLGRYSEAAPHLQEWLKLVPKTSPIWAYGAYALAVAEAGRGDQDKALAVLGQAVEAGYTGVQAIESERAFAGMRNNPRFAAVLEKLRRAAKPCEFEPEYRAFDFWIGTWDVFNQQGQKVGENVIQRINGGCTLLENWTSATGSTGKSFNMYNAQTKRWQQFWTDTGGNVLDANDGVASPEKIVFRGKYYLRQGGIQDYRLTFTKLAENKVRQVGEFTADSGKTWQLGYDFVYVKRQE